jgi:uncharacterized membrane protein
MTMLARLALALGLTAALLIGTAAPAHAEQRICTKRYAKTHPKVCVAGIYTAKHADITVQVLLAPGWMP